MGWFSYYIYEIGILFSWFRMRTKKYANVLSMNELRYVENVNNLDMQLWEWALEEFDKDFIMLDGYIHAIIYVTFIFLILLTCVIIMCAWLKCCLFKPKLPNSVDINEGFRKKD